MNIFFAIVTGFMLISFICVLIGIINWTIYNYQAVMAAIVLTAMFWVIGEVILRSIGI